MTRLPRWIVIRDPKGRLSEDGKHALIDVEVRLWHPGLWLEVLRSRAPEDPAERLSWAQQMARIQYAMWLDDGAKCAACGNPYASVDDFIARNLLAGLGWPGVGRVATPQFDELFVDDACADAYTAQHPEWPRGDEDGQT